MSNTYLCILFFKFFISVYFHALASPVSVVW